MPCQKETLTTNYEVNLRKPITLIYIYNWEIKAKISDSSLKFLSFRENIWPKLIFFYICNITLSHHTTLEGQRKSSKTQPFLKEP